MTRLLLINPNTTQAMTDQMHAVASALAGPDVTVTSRTATRGVPYIASRAEAQLAGAEALDMLAKDVLARDGSRHDAAIIAAFGDPGIVAARELFDMPIVGMAEASIMSAALLGERFSIVTFSPVMARWYVDCVRQTGLEARFTGVRCPDHMPDHLDNVAVTLRAELIALCERAVCEDGADVVILGGAPLAGLAQQIGSDAPGILVDPISAAVVQALGLARMQPSYARRAARPARKGSTGLGPDLATIIAGSTDATG
ncbi:MAG: hydrogenase expression protein HupH [Rhodobacteraceae bacterium]|nr:hydrogenase expression protein HupH [Paracoccaceae bacterium]